MKTYVKPSGAEVEVNQNSYALAESMGWKVKQDPKQEQPKRVGRPPKAKE